MLSIRWLKNNVNYRSFTRNTIVSGRNNHERSLMPINNIVSCVVRFLRKLVISFDKCTVGHTLLDSVGFTTIKNVFPDYQRIENGCRIIWFQTNYTVSVNSIHEWRHLQFKFSQERQIFEELCNAEFLPEICWE